MELSFFIEEVWLASCPSPLSIFLSPPRFLLPGSPSSILPYTRRPSLLQRGNTFHNISTLCRQYCIFLYDIPDWSMNIWFSPSDSFVTNFDVSLNCHKFHISAFSSIPANFPIAGTHVSSLKRWNSERSHFQKLAFNCRAKWIFHKPYFLK